MNPHALFPSKASLYSATRDVLDYATHMVNPHRRGPRLARLRALVGEDFTDVWELIEVDGSSTDVEVDDIVDVYALLRPTKARPPTARDVLSTICALETGGFVIRRTRLGWHARSPEGNVACLHTHNVFEACTVLNFLRRGDVRIDAQVGIAAWPLPRQRRYRLNAQGGILALPPRRSSSTGPLPAAFRE